MVIKTFMRRKEKGNVGKTVPIKAPTKSQMACIIFVVINQHPKDV